MAKKNSIVVGLDIGTSKVCAIVGEMTEHGVEIIGIGSHPSQGLRKGVVINIEARWPRSKKRWKRPSSWRAVKFIPFLPASRAVISRLSTATASSRSKTKKSRSAIWSASSTPPKPWRSPWIAKCFMCLPQDYIIDEQDGIKEPLGMSGVRLEAKVYIVTGAVTSAQNIVKCCNRTGLNVAEIVLAPLAAAEAVLGEEERELGVVLVDMGGGTTDIAIYHDGTVKHTAVIRIGGNHVTNDIAAGLRTPFNDAERIKQRFGFAKATMVTADERVEVPSVAGKGSGSGVAADPL